MREPVYKIGDVLEFTEIIPRQFGLLSRPVRGLIVNISDPGYEYISYRLLLYGNAGCARIMTISCALEKDILTCAKRIGHIDISMLMFKENNEPDYQTMMMAATIMHSANLGNELDKVKEENEKLKAENKALSDTLSKSEAKAQSRLDKNEVLKRENEELRGYNKELYQALSDSEKKANSRVDKITLLMHKVDDLESEKEKLEKELNQKKQELKWVYDSDTMSKVVELMRKNDELQKDIVKLKDDNHKLETERAMVIQKMSCANILLRKTRDDLESAMKHNDLTGGEKIDG